MRSTNQAKLTVFCMIMVHLLGVSTAFEVSGTSISWIDLTGTDVAFNGPDRTTTFSVSFSNEFSGTPDYVIYAIAGVRFTTNEFQIRLTQVSKTKNLINLKLTAYEGSTINRIGVTVFAMKNVGNT